VSYDRFGNKTRAKAARERKAAKKAAAMPAGKFFGAREAKKLAAIRDEIEECEKNTLRLAKKTVRLYYDAGNIIAGALRHWDIREKNLSAKNLADASGFPERRITLALKIFKRFENNPDALGGLAMRDVLNMIAPPPPAGEDGYNRVDLGGDPGQMKFDFGELFELPAAANQSLKHYRTVGSLISEIVVVKRLGDGSLTSKCFNTFHEDIPQNTLLRHAYKMMSQKTQAAIEDYLAALEQEEGKNEN
jgi:hypothetical protein